MPDPRDLPWLDPALPPAARAELVLAALSFDEKVALALGDFGAVAHLGIPAFEYTDGPNGVRGADGATAFPSAQALAATFDEDLAEAYGRAVAAEVRASGHDVWLGPAVDIARTPLAGRLAEALGEDPLLAGRIAAAEVRGARDEHVVAMVKHFVANNFERGRTGEPTLEGRSDAIDVIVDESTLRELYLAPFRAALEAGAGSLMGSYNRLNGEYTCQSARLMAIPKQEWGWQGCVVPDFLFAVRDPVAAAVAGLDVPALGGPGGRTAADFSSGSIPGERLDDICRRVLWTMFDAGLVEHPLEPPRSPRSAAHLDLATRIATDAMVLLANDGVLPFDEAVRSIAVVGTAGQDAQFVMGGSASVALPAGTSTPLAGIARRAGPRVHLAVAAGTPGEVLLPSVPSDAWTAVEGHEGEPAAAGLLARYWPGPSAAGDPVAGRVEPGIDVARTPAFLPPVWCARWEGTLIPRRSGLHRFAIECAGAVRMSVDDRLIASGHREAVAFFGPACPVGGTVELAAGVPAQVRVEYETGAAIVAPEIGLVGPTVRLGWLEPDGRIQEAAAAAASADVAVVVVSFAAGEGMDRTTLRLPGDQDELVSAVARANPRTVVVVNGGGPVLMPWLSRVAAVVQAWNPGERFGDALAAVLFGDDDAAGRLPITFPADDAHGPVQGEEQFPGVAGRATYSEGLFVGYRWFDAHPEQEPLFPFGHGLSYARTAWSDLRLSTAPGGLSASLTLANMSTRAGSEVVQLYITGPERRGRPPKALVDFARVRLGPGETRTVTLRIGLDQLRAFDADSGEWTLESGTYQALACASARDVRSRAAFGVDAAGEARVES